MWPNAQPERHDAPGLGNELVPCVSAVIDDVVLAGEHPVREPVVAHELPNILLQVQLGALGGQRHDGDVRRHGQPFGDVPPGLVQQEHGMLFRRVPGGQFKQEQLHCGDVAPGQDQTGRLAVVSHSALPERKLVTTQRMSSPSAVASIRAETRRLQPQDLAP